MENRAGAEALFTSILRFSRTLQGLGHYGEPVPGELTRTDVAVLGMIEQLGPCRGTVLAERLWVGPSAISREVACLETQGLVTRETDPTDRRAGLLALTELGRSRLAAARSGYIDRLARHLDDWDAPALVEMAGQLERLCDSLVPAASPSGKKELL